MSAVAGQATELPTDTGFFDPPDPPTIDAHLRRLASRESACRLALGRLAARFLAVKGHHALGFARLGDYTRERLGISAREIQSYARVASALPRLPELAAAFVSGGISWSHARLLVAVATPESVARWVALARRYTVRGLEVLVGRHRRPSLVDDEEATIDGEPRVIFRLPCPRHVRVQWRELVELGRRISGAPVRMWEAAESVAAEALSGAEVVPPDAPGSPPPARRAPEPLLRAAAEEHALGPDDLPDHHTRDPFELDARMRLVMATMQRIDWETGRALRLLLRRGAHRQLGFNCLAHYARERLGMSERKARSLMTLDWRTAAPSALGDAYRRGHLSWLRALTLLPVARAQVAPAWIERAQAVTLRRLVDEVQWALDTIDLGGGAAASTGPPPLGSALSRPNRQMCAPHTPTAVDAQVLFAAPASVVGLLHQAIAAFSAHDDPPWRAFERMLAHARAEWQRWSRHPDPVFARDAWRCAVPACSSRRTLHDHHILFRSRGGTNARDNRITVCAWHHLRGIHGGRIHAHGHAPHDVTWEMGLRRGRAPLLRLLGDRYAAST